MNELDQQALRIAREVLSPQSYLTITPKETKDLFAAFAAFLAEGQEQYPTVTVRTEYIDWLKTHYPALCEKSGLCERIGGRLYTKTVSRPAPKEVEKMDIKAMVDRFLAWKLPTDFAPDGGISFTPRDMYRGGRYEPVGTNLLTAEQARTMFEYVLAGQEVEKGSEPRGITEECEKSVPGPWHDSTSGWAKMPPAHTDHPSRPECGGKYADFHKTKAIGNPVTDPQEEPVTELGDGVLYCDTCHEVVETAHHGETGRWCKGVARWIQGPFYTRPQHDRVSVFGHSITMEQDRDSWKAVVDSYEADRLEQKAKIAEQAAALEDLRQAYDKRVRELEAKLDENAEQAAELVIVQENYRGAAVLCRDRLEQITEQAARIADVEKVSSVLRRQRDECYDHMDRRDTKIATLTAQRDKLIESAREVIKHHGSDDVLDLAAVLAEIKGRSHE